MLYLVLILLFLVQWLITNAVCGFWLGYRSGSTHEVSTIPRTSDDEQTQTTPEYAIVVLSTNGRNHLDTEKSTISHMLLLIIRNNQFVLRGITYFSCTFSSSNLPGDGGFP